VNRLLEKLTTKLVKKPKLIFLIDSIGAFLTALLLFVILKNLTYYFGMPTTNITLLSSLAACFCLYSAICFLFLKGKWKLFIKIISFANLLYCLLTLGFLFVNYNQITSLDLTYFLLEIVIICTIVYIELTVWSRI
jgi:hypothetical protein